MNESNQTRNSEQRRGVLHSILIAVIVMQLSGFGVESRVQQISIVLIAIASWLAVEFYGRNLRQISDRWSELLTTFFGEANARRRLAYAAAMFFPSLYIIVLRILAGDNTPDNGDGIVLGTGIIGFCWMLLECFNVAEYARSESMVLLPFIPDNFPQGSVFNNLLALAGPEATDKGLLSCAREFSNNDEWLGLCRQIIASNRPDGEFALLQIGLPSRFGDIGSDFVIWRSEPDSLKLYHALVSRSGLPSPGVPELMGVAYSIYEHPDDLRRCLDAIQKHAGSLGVVPLTDESREWA